MDSEAADSGLVLVIPVYNDWSSLGSLLDDLDGVLADRGLPVTVVVVNDCSAVACDEAALGQTRRALSKVVVLDLVRNLGHQRAIAVGLVWVYEHLAGQAVVVMDGDGEDQPADVLKLLDTAQPKDSRKAIVFAERERRSEGVIFRCFYVLYKFMFLLMTGKQVKGGNFTLVPWEQLACLAHTGEIWNHYAAAIVKSKVPYTSVKTERGRRYDGRSQMGFLGLIAHGLSAISVFGELIGIRMLVASMVMGAVPFIGILITVAVRMLTDWAVPGWATYTTGLLGIMLMQSVLMSLLFVFLSLNSRQSAMQTPYPGILRFVLSTREFDLEGK